MPDRARSSEIDGFVAYKSAMPSSWGPPAAANRRRDRAAAPTPFRRTGTRFYARLGLSTPLSLRDRLCENRNQGEYSRKDVEYSTFGRVRLDGYFGQMFSAPHFTARKVMSQAIGRLFRGMARQSWGLAK